MRGLSFFAFAVAVAGALFLAAPATAQTFPVVVNCTSVGQTCTPLYSTPITVGTTGPITLSFTISGAGCSSAQVIMSVDSTPVYTSAFLAPGQTASFTTASLSAGPHSVSLQAIGQVGGCNSGNLGSWGGSLNVSAGISSTPAPGTWILFTLGLACLGIYQARDRFLQLIRGA